MKISNLRFAEPSNTLINMEVTLEEGDAIPKFCVVGQVLPFTYSATDDAPVSLAVTELLALGGYSVAAYVAPPPAPVLSVTPRQMRLALTQAGIRANIESYVAGASQDVKDTWEFATVIERNSPIIDAGAAALGLTESDIDGLFTLASTL